jgi:hypothetical protein
VGTVYRERRLLLCGTGKKPDSGQLFKHFKTYWFPSGLGCSPFAPSEVDKLRPPSFQRTSEGIQRCSRIEMLSLEVNVKIDHG